jgi:hypothetical protein
MMAKRPIASVNANPKSPKLTKRASLPGLRAIAINKPAKTIPIPVPALSYLI